MSRTDNIEEVVSLSPELLPAFLNYCRLHEKDHDESFLDDEELGKFQIDENITKLLLQEGKVVGAFSIIPDRSNRTRIFHTEEGREASYRLLHNKMTEVLGENTGSRKYNLYIPEEKTEVIETLQNLGLKTDRRIYVLERPHLPVPEAPLPAGFSLYPFRLPEDIPDWTRVRNEVMSELKGFVPYPEEKIAKMYSSEYVLKEATLILREKDGAGSRTIGIIGTDIDKQPEETFGFIGPIALLPEYRGRGLGRAMLRRVLEEIEAREWRGSLCVNTDNDEGLRLYLSEGFQITETVLALVFGG